MPKPLRNKALKPQKKKEVIESPPVEAAEEESVEAAPAALVPAPQTPLGITGPLNMETLGQYESELLVRNARKILPAMFRSMGELLKKNDRMALQLAAEIYNYKGKSSVPSIVTNIQQNFGSGVSGSKAKQEEQSAVYFESLVRSLDADAQKKKDEDKNIIDAEVVE